MYYKINITGIKDTVERLAASPDKLSKSMCNALKHSSVLIERSMRRNAPVNTGVLKKSIKSEINYNNFSLTVGPDVPYAVWVELGHHLRNGRFLKGQYFVRKTYLQVQSSVRDIFKKEINNNLNAK